MFTKSEELPVLFKEQQQKNKFRFKAKQSNSLDFVLRILLVFFAASAATSLENLCEIDNVAHRNRAIYFRFCLYRFSMQKTILIILLNTALTLFFTEDLR